MSLRVSIHRLWLQKYNLQKTIENNGLHFRNAISYGLVSLSERPFSQAKRGKREQTTSHYDVLSVDHKATQRQIRDAYIQLSKVYHPDVNVDPAHASKFSQISNAYKILSNPVKKKNYDREYFFHGVHQQDIEDEDDSGIEQKRIFEEKRGYKEFGKNIGPPPRIQKMSHILDEETYNLINSTRLRKQKDMQNIKDLQAEEKSLQQEYFLDPVSVVFAFIIISLLACFARFF